MARGSRSSGSYREWEAARRAEERAAEQAARLEEQRRKARERERAVAEAAARDRKAAARTLAVDQRIAELEGLLRSSLARDPRISLASLRRRAAVPPLDLGQLGIPLRAPEWEDFESEPERGLRRMFGEAHGSRKAEMQESRRAKQMTRDSAYLNRTPMGDIVCVYLEGDDPIEGNRQFAASTSPFDTWFKQQAGEAFGLDFNQPVPPVQQIQDWQRT